MSTTKRNSGNVYTKPTADVETFDFLDVIRTSGEVESPKEVGADYTVETNWDNLLKGGMN